MTDINRALSTLIVFGGIAAFLALTVAWSRGARRPSLTEAAEKQLGSGAACGRPDHETVLCVHEGRRYLCVRGRSGTTACAETIGGGAER